MLLINRILKFNYNYKEKIRLLGKEDGQKWVAMKVKEGGVVVMNSDAARQLVGAGDRTARL